MGTLGARNGRWHFDPEVAFYGTGGKAISTKDGKERGDDGVFNRDCSLTFG